MRNAVALVLPLVIAAACASSDRPPGEGFAITPPDDAPPPTVTGVPADARPVDDGIPVTDWCGDKTGDILCDDFEHNDIYDINDPWSPWNGDNQSASQGIVLARRAAPAGQPGHAVHFVSPEQEPDMLTFGFRKDPLTAGSPNATLTLAFMVYLTAPVSPAVDVATLQHGAATLSVSTDNLTAGVWHNVVMTAALVELETIRRKIVIDDQTISDVADLQFDPTADRLDLTIGSLATVRDPDAGVTDLWIDRFDVQLTTP